MGTGLELHHHRIRISVAVTTDKGSYANRENVRITIGVTDGSNPVASSAVHIRVTTADGDILGGDSTTNSAGITTFKYKVNSKRSGVGTYTIDATATKNGYDSGSGSNTFEVTN